MGGETDLDRLLGAMQAELIEDVYVFVTVAPTSEGSDAGLSDLSPRMIFQEAEGTTYIVTRQQARERGLAFEFPSRMITLNIHSSLDAVGFMARIATALAAAGMGVNPVAGYFHDHLFVPEDRAADAMAVLTDLAAAAKR